jgi:hypothetical protein
MGAMRAIAAILAFGLAFALPNAATAQDAESGVYAAAKDCSGLRSYLRSYPNGRFRADAQARIAKDCEAPKPVMRAAAPPPAPVDPCIRARADWPQISGSNDLSVLRTFLSATSYECQVQRAQAASRISEIETVQRDAAARQAAAQQAEANRIAAEQAQAQALLNRSWSAIAVSDWGDFWGTSYIDWGGVTGQPSPEAAKAAAIKACDDKGDGKDCALITEPYNQGCLAFAYKGSDLTDGSWNWGGNLVESAAREEALKNCTAKGCKVQMVICAKPG